MSPIYILLIHIHIIHFDAVTFIFDIFQVIQVEHKLHWIVWTLVNNPYFFSIQIKRYLLLLPLYGVHVPVTDTDIKMMLVKFIHKIRVRKGMYAISDYCGLFRRLPAF